jgi:hypothetical protein
MLARVPALDVEAVLKRLGQLARDTIPDGHAFVQLERRDCALHDDDLEKVLQRPEVFTVAGV